MNFLYISPEFPPNFQNFTIELNKLGVNVYGIGNTPFNNLPENLRSSMKWYISTDLENKTHFFSALNYMMSEANISSFDIIESHNEHWLQLESILNERFNTDGVDTKNVQNWKNKHLMKKVLIDNDLPHIKGEIISSTEKALKFSNLVGYPIILKPDIGVGASGVQKIYSDDELKHALNTTSEIQIIEEFIDAPMLTYDGLTDRFGNVIFESSFHYSTGVMNYLNGVDPCCYITPKIPTELSNLGKNMLKSFNVKNKFFHLEFFHTEAGFIPIEANIRPPGGHVLDMMNYSADCNLYQIYAQMISNEVKTNSFDDKFYCGFVGRRDKHYKVGHNEIYKNFKDEMVKDFIPPELYWQAMGKHVYIFRSKSLDTMKDLMKQLTETV